jgi:uncharacterized protein involved in type VI secretion and phage assembly
MDGAAWSPTTEDERESDGFLVGLAVGVVTDNKDPEHLARVRVKLPWHTGSDTSFWARTAMPMAGDDRGFYFLPEVGTEVLVGAEKGDPSHLYVLGALWNGKQKPPVTDDDGNNTRLVKSRSKHTVRFNDDPNAPEIEVRLSDDRRILLDQDTIVIDDAHQNVITFRSGSGAIEISATQQLTLKAASISIEATAALNIKSSGTLALNGAVVQIN